MILVSQSKKTVSHNFVVPHKLMLQVRGSFVVGASRLCWWTMLAGLQLHLTIYILHLTL